MSEPIAEQAADQIDAAAQPPEEESRAAEQAEEKGAEGNETGKEAAKYRRRLREAEAQRDDLAGRLEAMHRTEVERLAAARLVNPAGLWAAGVEVGDLLAEDGTIDTEKVAEAAEKAAAELGLESPRARLLRGNHVNSEGNNPLGADSASWADAFDAHKSA